MLKKFLVILLTLISFQVNSVDADKVKNAIKNEAVGVAKSYFEKYFEVFELHIDSPDDLSSAGILIVKGLSDPEDVENTVFTQMSTFVNAGRATVNLGLGYRRLLEDNKLLLGINTFYDHEFPYRHGRASLGLEARTSVGEVNFNRYWATTGWQAGAENLDEHALGGVDLEIGIPLPYMNWATFYAKAFKWNTETPGVKDSIGNTLSIDAAIPVIPGLVIAAGHTQYSSDESSDNFVLIEYDLIAAGRNEKAPLFTKYAYKLDSMEDQRYQKVRRENKIYKQKRSTTVTVKGF
jgi:adhesin/invasin